MFIVSLNYIQPIDKIEQYLSAHREYLEKYYQSGYFLMSGRKEPRSGGIILAKAENVTELQRIIDEDPFKRYAVAEYHIIEFKPSKTAADLAQYCELV